MREILARMIDLTRDGRPFVVATVVRTQGSTPQVVGARLLVDDAGGLLGTLGGGCVEGDAIAEARRQLVERGSSLRAYDLTEPLGWDTGLVCGGTMWIHVESDRVAFDGVSVDQVWQSLAGAAPIALGTSLRLDGRTIAADGHRLVGPDVARAGRVDGDVLSDRALTLVADAFNRGVARLIPVAPGHELLVEPIVARPRLVVAGGGHVALALVDMARLLDFAITVIDDRDEFANAARFPGVEALCGDIPSLLSRLDVGWNTFIVVATRGHKLDAHCLRAAVATRARYVGLLGSARKTVLIERMLRDEGVSEERLRDVHAPIGLDLGGRTPAEIALSVLSEISQERYGGTGRPLRLSDERFEKAVLRS